MPDPLVSLADPFGVSLGSPPPPPLPLEPRGTRPEVDLVALVSQVVMIQTRLAGERRRLAAGAARAREEGEI